MRHNALPTGTAQAASNTRSGLSHNLSENILLSLGTRPKSIGATWSLRAERKTPQ